jgi:hypothetical protein
MPVGVNIFYTEDAHLLHQKPRRASASVKPGTWVPTPRPRIGDWTRRGACLLMVNGRKSGQTRRRNTNESCLFQAGMVGSIFFTLSPRRTMRLTRAS